MIYDDIIYAVVYYNPYWIIQTQIDTDSGWKTNI